MIRNLEDKMASDEDFARREERMAEYQARRRLRVSILAAPDPASCCVRVAAQPRCDVFRVDTSEGMTC